VVTTEQFNRLAAAIMRSQRVPQSIAIEIKGNPEFIPDEELAIVADRVIEQIVDRLTREHAVSGYSGDT
jgi:hypothetical protein